MTIFGPDLSSFQDGLDAGALPHPFVIMKISEGTYYTDRDYPTWRAQAQASGKIPIGYHFISGEDPAAQAAHLAACIGDKSLPLMLDWEPNGTFQPTLKQLLAVADAMAAAGLRVRLAYAPRWHWAALGSPSLAGLTDRGIALVASAYPGGTGYPGDGAAGWLPYGGLTPLLYQYTDHAPVQGRGVDMNAYRGTAEQLAAFLNGVTVEARDVWAFKNPALDQIDMRQRVVNTETAAEQALAEIRALAAKYSAPPPVDVDALAAALVPRIAAGMAAGVDVKVLADQCAHAVVVKLGAVLTAPAGGA